MEHDEDQYNMGNIRFNTYSGRVYVDIEQKDVPKIKRTWKSNVALNPVGLVPNPLGFVLNLVGFVLNPVGLDVISAPSDCLRYLIGYQTLPPSNAYKYTIFLFYLDIPSSINLSSV
ncbi:unnamed protein product [Cuscuta epithymum]|uniref:Uncharacterized protein n=1 Tax=Cuscuta epithymum TaxID=186058 RepID=A0AAV0EGZ0_9ASTE|nr:unnamed protein product [Cuscuta epithymum]CAH9123107.1 unnamed protein product [Cuscuta epithymum]